MKILAIALFLTLSVNSHAACLKRGSSSISVQSLDLSTIGTNFDNKPTIRIHKVLSGFEINDKFYYSKAHGHFVWQRGNKEQILYPISKKGTGKDGEDIRYFLLHHPELSKDVYLFYQEAATCKLIDPNYSRPNALKNCKGYHLEMFSKIDPGEPFSYVRPDHPDAKWTSDCGSTGLEPGTGGGIEPP